MSHVLFTLCRTLNSVTGRNCVAVSSSLARSAFALGLAWFSVDALAQANPGLHAAVAIIAGMPPVIDASNLYSETSSNRLSNEVAGHLSATCANSHTSFSGADHEFD
jgi:hypothetical protein